MYIDTHAHVNFKAFKDDWQAVLDDCLAQSTFVVNVGSQFSTSKRAVELAEKFNSGVYAIVGLHPVHLFPMHIDEEGSSFESREEQFDYNQYKELAQNPKVVGIGECGLEYFHLPAPTPSALRAITPRAEGEVLSEVKRKQKEVFEQQIKLAAEVNKALMVHSRDAYEDVYEIIKGYAPALRAVVVHSFIGNWAQAEKFLSLGCYISFNGIITYKPRKEKKPGQSDPGLLEAVRLTSLDRILLETDCPYLAPEPVRGSRNLPTNVKIVAQKIAELKGIDVAEVERQTVENAKKAFAI